MLLALLFANEDCLTAAAPACEQQPYGDRYWQEFHPGTTAFTSDCQTAYVEVGDDTLCNRLLNMAYEDTFATSEEAAMALDAYLESNHKRGTLIERRAA